MNARWIITAVIVMGLALEGGLATSSASPSAQTPAPVLFSPTLTAGAANARPALNQQAIFEILCGGAPVPSPWLHAHLWQVAGSLAARSWTPPQVTVRFAVGYGSR